jgi:hypothetical protein
VLETADRAAAGGVTQIYNEGRVQRDAKRRARRR